MTIICILLVYGRSISPFDNTSRCLFVLLFCLFTLTRMSVLSLYPIPTDLRSPGVRWAALQQTPGEHRQLHTGTGPGCPRGATRPSVRRAVGRGDRDSLTRFSPQQAGTRSAFYPRQPRGSASSGAAGGCTRGVAGGRRTLPREDQGSACGRGVPGNPTSGRAPLYR